MSTARSCPPAFATAARNSGKLRCSTPLEGDRSTRSKKVVSASSARHARLTSLQRSRESTGRRRNTARTKQRGRGERTVSGDARACVSRPRVSMTLQEALAVRRWSSRFHAQDTLEGDTLRQRKWSCSLPQSVRDHLCCRATRRRPQGLSTLPSSLFVRKIV